MAEQALGGAQETEKKKMDRKNVRPPYGWESDDELDAALAEERREHRERKAAKEADAKLSAQVDDMSETEAVAEKKLDELLADLLHVAPWDTENALREAQTGEGDGHASTVALKAKLDKAYRHLKFVETLGNDDLELYKRRLAIRLHSLKQRQVELAQELDELIFEMETEAEVRE